MAAAAPPGRAWADLVVVGGVLGLVSLLFLIVPQLDVTVSNLFFDAAHGFSGHRYAIVEGVRDAGRWVEWMFAIIVCIPYPLKLIFPAHPLLIRPRATLFVLASFLIGPGLIVNGILKEFWGRARPRSIVEFGGDATFSPAWWIADQCDRNCSFASGEAASAFWVVGLAFIVPTARRRIVLASTLLFAAAVSATRVAAGGHFISDVLIAWLLTLLVMLASKTIILDGLPPSFDAVIEECIARAGRAARRLLAGHGTRPGI